jgi:hypothetical protein
MKLNMLSIVMLSVVMLSVVMLSVVMLSVVMLSVIMISVVMVSVVAPDRQTFSTEIMKKCKKWRNLGVGIVFANCLKKNLRSKFVLSSN